MQISGNSCTLAAPAEMGAIQTRLSECYCTLDTLFNKVERLRENLRPVLMPETVGGPENKAQGCVGPQLPPLGHEIEGLRERMLQTIDQLNDILNRLEV